MNGQKILSVVCTGALSLMLVACGAQQNDTTNAQDVGVEQSAEQPAEQSAEQPAEPSAGQPAEKTDKQSAPANEAAKKHFVGEWMLAGIESYGLTVTGDLTETLDGGAQILTLADDGKGSLDSPDGDVHLGIAWELTGDDSAKLTLTSKGEASSKDATATYDAAGNAIVMETENEGVDLTMTFSADGRLASTPNHDLANATDPTSVDEIVGTWKPYVVGENGAVVFGDFDYAEELGGNYTELTQHTLNIADDGTVTTEYEGEEDTGTLVIEDGKAYVRSGGVDIPVKMLDDNLVLERTELSSPSNMETFVIYQKS